jgi:hypothetical protein
MAMEGLTECAAGCGAPISGASNLCELHRVPGGVVRVGNYLMIVTAWYVEHNHEPGVILLNDWALGVHFGGRAGFEARLKEQGFTAVRNIATPEELEAVKSTNKLAGWGGPWLTKYPWEESRNRVWASKMEKPIVFHFAPELKEEAKAIMGRGCVAKAIAKVEDELGECFGYEVHLVKGETADLDLNVYPITEETFKKVTGGLGIPPAERCEE